MSHMKVSSFDQVVRDAIKLLNKQEVAYCFYQDQVDEVKKVFPNIIVEEVGSMFYLSKSKERKGSDVYGKRKSN